MRLKEMDLPFPFPFPRKQVCCESLMLGKVEAHERFKAPSANSPPDSTAGSRPPAMPDPVLFPLPQ